MRVLHPVEQERSAIQVILKDLAEYYSVTLSDKQVDMYTDDLIELGSELTMKAVVKYRQTWHSVKFPLPATLRNTIKFGVSYRNVDGFGRIGYLEG